ncbi:hypothetical protein ACQP2H_29495 [Micromonospora sp. CA-248260]|uniref:hypothetical protein n=1 Tax=Micromonospora sp. CA-248260 TaxID=3239962 RepID=UPI003D8AFA73
MKFTPGTAALLSTGVAVLSALLSTSMAWYSVRRSTKNLATQLLFQRDTDKEKRLWEKRAEAYINWMKVTSEMSLNAALTLQAGKLGGPVVLEIEQRAALSAALAQLTAFGSPEVHDLIGTAHSIERLGIILQESARLEVVAAQMRSELQGVSTLDSYA